MARLHGSFNCLLCHPCQSVRRVRLTQLSYAGLFFRFYYRHPWRGFMALLTACFVILAKAIAVTGLPKEQ